VDLAVCEAEGRAAMSSEPRPRSVKLLALFFAIGLIAFGYAWTTVHRRSMATLSSTDGPIRAHAIITHWINHGFFASYGMLWPTPDEKFIYRSGTGAFMVSGFLLEKVWMAMTGRYGWRLLALHNEMVLLLIASLLALLAFRIARRLGGGPVHAFVLAVAAQMVWFTFPENLAGFWFLPEQTWCLLPAIVFLLLEERALDRGRKRLLTTLQALAVFALTYIEYVVGTMFIVSYVATIFLLRGDRPSFKRLGAILLLPWICALAIYGIELLGVRQVSRQTGAKLTGSDFLYRSGLDGDAMFYGDHLDIAFGRDVVRGGRSPHLFRWEWLFFCGLAAVLATLAAYVRGLVPRIAVETLIVLIGSWLLYAAVFSQAVALHPYLFDVMLATPLIVALFAFVPALAESRTNQSGLIVLLAIFAATWLSMFQLRVYAMLYPSPQPAAVLRATSAP
jgi:hypothetical protein